MTKYSKFEKQQELSRGLKTPALNMPPPPPPIEEKRNSSFLKTGYLLIVAPILIVVGFYVAGLNQTEAFMDMNLQGSTVGYPYSYIGTALMLTAAMLLSVGLAYRWAKSVSRGGLIVTQIIGWLVCAFAIALTIFGGSVVWANPVSTSMSYSIQSFVSINPTISGIATIIWFAGTTAIAWGLIPMRRWLNKSIV